MCLFIVLFCLGLPFRAVPLPRNHMNGGGQQYQINHASGTTVNIWFNISGRCCFNLHLYYVTVENLTYICNTFILGSQTRISALELPIISNFEDGTMSPWFDSSTRYSYWVVEDFNTPLEFWNPVPKPADGSWYLRVNRDRMLGETESIKLVSERFYASPGDVIKLKYWLHSDDDTFLTVMLYNIT